MARVLVAAGEARDEKELFEFTVEPFVTGSYLLSIRYSGDCCQNVTGAGVWPTIEKAKQRNPRRSFFTEQPSCGVTSLSEQADMGE